MSTSYALLLGLVIFLVVFIYFVFFSVSLRLEKNHNEYDISVKRKSVPFRWKDLIDSKINDIKDINSEFFPTYSRLMNSKKEDWIINYTGKLNPFDFELNSDHRVQMY